MGTGITVEHEFDVRRALGDVFAFVSDRERLPAWTAGIKRVRRTSTGLVGAGTTYSVTGRLLGRRVDASYEVTACEPDTRYAGRMVSRVFTFEESYRFEENGEGTRVQLRAKARPQGALRLLGPLLSLGLPRQVHADHQRLKLLLERARPRAAPTPTPEGEEADTPVTEG